MRILINATALVERGPYSVIVDFLEQLNSREDYLQSKNINITVLVTKNELLKYSSENIKVILESYPKKGLFQRLYFERFLLPNILREHGADAYLSMQNTSLYKGDVPQFVLIQQCLHFAKLKFKEIELIYFIKYPLLMNLFTIISIKNYDGIIVQTNWVKDALISKYGYKGGVEVIRPSIKSISNRNEPLSKLTKEKLDIKDSKLLYVTSIEKYKNNDLLVEAVKEYNRKASSNKKIVLFLTIDGSDENGIKYLGKVPYEGISNLYKSVDALIFPSLCETLGLPLMEAMEIGLAVLASDLPYAREVCGNKGIYFEARSRESIVSAINKFMSGEQRALATDVRNNELKASSYIEYIDYILNRIQKPD